MAVSVYLSNNTVQIVCGDARKKQIRVEKIYSLTIPEGSLLNGVITSEMNLKHDLKQIWETYQLPSKGVRLVLDSSQIMLKTVQTPKANAKKILASVAQEFADTINIDQYVFDGKILREEAGQKKVEVLAAAAEQEYLADFVRMFQDIGVTLEGIDVAVNAQMKVLGRIPELKKETMITSHLDGNNLVSTLIVDGNYKYFNRTRLFSEHGTEGFAAEVARTVSSIMQFYSSQKYEKPLEQVYMGGYSAQDYELCREAIERLGMRAQIPENSDAFAMPETGQTVVESDLKGEPVRTCDYIYAIGALIQDKGDIDFYERYRKGQKRTAKSGLGAGKLIPIIVTFGVCAVASVVVLAMNMITQRKIDKAEEYIENPANQLSYMDALDKQAEASRLQSMVREGEGIWEIIHSYPMPNSKVEQEIVQCAGDEVSITVNSYDAKTGVYEFTAQSSNVTIINEFITRLRESAVFANLEYSGYSMEEKTGNYLIMVNGFLNENAGK